ncbi:hypothetical protein ERO13_A04G090750v2, partial [Gossypium hirsutum]
HPSIINCFEENDALEKFNTYFATHTFKYLDQLCDWVWLECLQLRGPCYDNLVRAFYSNAKLKHNSTTHLVQSITSSVMGQEITISVETLSSYLFITNEGDEHHTGSYNTSLTRPNDYVGNDMDIHDHILHLIFTWIVSPTNKNFSFRHTDYWMWHCFRTDHPLNLASIIFLNLLEIVRINVSVDPGRSINSFIDISTAHSCN